MTKAELIYAITGDVERYLQAIKDDKPDHFANVGKMAEDTQIEETIGIDSSDMDCLGIHAKTIIKKLIAKQYEVINKVNAHSTVLLAQHKEIEEIKEQLDY